MARLLRLQVLAAAVLALAAFGPLQGQTAPKVSVNSLTMDADGGSETITLTDQRIDIYTAVRVLDSSNRAVQTVVGALGRTVRGERDLTLRTRGASPGRYRVELVAGRNTLALDLDIEIEAPPAPDVSSLELQTRTIEPGLRTSAEVRLTAPAMADVEVRLISSDPGIARVPESVLVKAGGDRIDFQVQASATSPGGSAKITALVGSSEASAELVVSAPPPQLELASLELGSDAPVRPDQPATVTATLSAPAPAGGTTLDITIDQPDYIGIPSQTVVVEGATQAVFQVSADDILPTPRTLTIDVSLDGGSPESITVEALPGTMFTGLTTMNAMQDGYYDGGVISLRLNFDAPGNPGMMLFESSSDVIRERGDDGVLRPLPISRQVAPNQHFNLHIDGVTGDEDVELTATWLETTHSIVIPVRQPQLTEWEINWTDMAPGAPQDVVGPRHGQCLVRWSDHNIQGVSGTVELSTDRPDLVTIPDSRTSGLNSAGASFTCPVAAVSEPTPVTMTATYLESTLTAEFVVLPTPVASVSVLPADAVERNHRSSGWFTARVELADNTPEGINLPVDVTTDRPDLVTISEAPAPFAPFETAKEFHFDVADVTLTEPQTVVVTASSGPSQASTSVVIQPDFGLTGLSRIGTPTRPELYRGEVLEVLVGLTGTGDREVHFSSSHPELLEGFQESVVFPGDGDATLSWVIEPVDEYTVATLTATALGVSHTIEFTATRPTIDEILFFNPETGQEVREVIGYGELTCSVRWFDGASEPPAFTELLTVVTDEAQPQTFGPFEIDYAATPTRRFDFPCGLQSASDDGQIVTYTATLGTDSLQSDVMILPLADAAPVALDPSSFEIRPGETVTVRLSVDSPNGGWGSITSSDDRLVVPPGFDVQSGTTEVDFDVTVPSDADVTESVSVTIRVVSQNGVDAVELQLELMPAGEVWADH